jgi:hypothetical protein
MGLKSLMGWDSRVVVLLVKRAELGLEMASGASASGVIVLPINVIAKAKISKKIVSGDLE